MKMKKLGLVLLASGVLPYLVMQTWVLAQQRTWTPLRVPVSIRTGLISSPEFVTRASTYYNIFLEFNRRIEFQRMECLLGLAFDAATKCHGTPEAVDIAWQLTSDGHLSDAGSSRSYHMGAYSDTISRQIGAFKAKSGQHHVLKLDIEKDGRDLNSASPRLVVQVVSSYWEGTMILFQLTFFIAIILGGVGLLLLVIAAFRALRMRSASMP
jgi:hypothetical protein